MSSDVVSLSLETLIEEVKVEEAQMLLLVLVGSRLHGTSVSTSDYDFLLVVTDNTPLPEGAKVERAHLDVTIFTRSEYIAKLSDGGDFQTLEPLWVPEVCRWVCKEDFLPHWNGDLARVRVAVSSIASKGHAYAKILMTKEGNFRLAKKNLAHEIRNLRLGLQIVEHGRIVDYTETKELYEQIMAETSEDWAYYNQRWGAIAMTHQKEFISKTPEKVKVPKPPKHRRRRAEREEKASTSLQD